MAIITHCDKLEQLEFKLEKIIGIQKHAGKVRKVFYFEKSESNVTRPKKSKCILQRSIKLLQLINANVKWVMKFKGANLWNEIQFPKPQFAFALKIYFIR